jgi:mono/diheme cytochrome c family protein
MMRRWIWFSAGAIALALLIAIGSFLFLKTGANGFSARSPPSLIEVVAARQARGMAMPASAKAVSNPVVKSHEVLSEAMAHWADHCAGCHGNDGSGQVDLGRQMYPPAPDMRKAGTQDLTDGELFYVIENGIRLTGMPGWGGSGASGKDSWKLVHFIRHLPDLSATEIAEMNKMNPKSPEDFEHEQQEEQFLNGETPKDVPKQHKH